MAIFETALARGPRFILEQSEALGADRDGPKFRIPTS